MTTPMGAPILSSDEREQRVGRLAHLKQVVVTAAILMTVVVPLLVGLAAINIANDLSTVSKHESATALCEGLDNTNQHIQTFVLNLAQQQMPPPTAGAILQLQAELNAEFPQTDCSTYPIVPPTTPTTVAPATPAT